MKEQQSPCTEEDSEEVQKQKLLQHNFYLRIKKHIKEAYFLAHSLMTKGFVCLQSNLTREKALHFSRILELSYQNKLELLDKYETSDQNREMLQKLWQEIADA